jgi:hypothetical protein
VEKLSGPVEVYAGRRRSHRKLWIAATLLIVLFGATGTWVALRVKPWLHNRVLDALRTRFDSGVELKRLDISLMPPRVVGEGLVLRFKNRRDVPPLVTVDRLTVDAPLAGLFETPIRVQRLALEGLKIQIGPKSGDDESKASQHNPKQIYPFVIDEVMADGTLLRIIPKRADKEPLDFDLRKLHLRSAGPDNPMLFDALLTNAVPPGEIQTTGRFGPWQKEDPDQTPVGGQYTFTNADLGVFKGISGTLSSEGRYDGKLQRIEVNGTADIPDFAVGVSGNRVHLGTTFESVVDGTSGDTLLQPVEARFGKTSLVARGAIVGKKGVPGKRVSLDVTLNRGRIEDLLHLVMKGEQPLLTGSVKLKTKFDIPPGDVDVIDKINLDGELGIGNAEFTNATLQEKIDTLSRRGKGRPNDEGIDNVASNLAARFRLKNAQASFSSLSFDVPGAKVALSGIYGLHDEALDFTGSVKLQATVSHTTTGVKSFFLKMVDPLFKREGAGTFLPIMITGTRSDPSFKLDVKRTLLRR